MNPCDPVLPLSDPQCPWPPGSVELRLPPGISQLLCSLQPPGAQEFVKLSGVLIVLLYGLSWWCCLFSVLFWILKYLFYQTFSTADKMLATRKAQPNRCCSVFDGHLCPGPC